MWPLEQDMQMIHVYLDALCHGAEGRTERAVRVRPTGVAHSWSAVQQQGDVEYVAITWQCNPHLYSLVIHHLAFFIFHDEGPQETEAATKRLTSRDRLLKTVLCETSVNTYLDLCTYLDTVTDMSTSTWHSLQTGWSHSSAQRAQELREYFQRHYSPSLVGPARVNLASSASTPSPSPMVVRLRNVLERWPQEVTPILLRDGCCSGSCFS